MKPSLTNRSRFDALWCTKTLVTSTWNVKCQSRPEGKNALWSIQMQETREESWRKQFDLLTMLLPPLKSMRGPHTPFLSWQVILEVVAHGARRLQREIHARVNHTARTNKERSDLVLQEQASRSEKANIITDFKNAYSSLECIATHIWNLDMPNSKGQHWGKILCMNNIWRTTSEKSANVQKKPRKRFPSEQITILSFNHCPCCKTTTGKRVYMKR